MYNFISFLLILSSAVTLALPPQVSFDSMTDDGANTKLNYTFNEFGSKNKISLVDDDGVATLAALQYMLIQGPSEEIYLPKEPDTSESVWKKMKDSPVKGWNQNLQTTYIQALEKAIDFYTKNKLEGLEDLKKIHAQLKYSKQMAPSYSDLNEIGAWLNKNAAKHSYTMESRKGNEPVKILEGMNLNDNNTGNPLGTALAGRGYTLPTEEMSRSRASFEADLKSILTNYQSTKTGGSKNSAEGKAHQAEITPGKINIPINKRK